MAKIRGKVVVDAERCKGCGVCVASCPLSILALAKEVNAKGYNFAQLADAEKCTGCASCGIICPDSCIVVYRARVSE